MHRNSNKDGRKKLGETQKSNYWKNCLMSEIKKMKCGQARRYVDQNQHFEVLTKCQLFCAELPNEMKNEMRYVK